MMIFHHCELQKNPYLQNGHEFGGGVDGGDKAATTCIFLSAHSPSMHCL